jgi:hypothetical protein
MSPEFGTNGVLICGSSFKSQPVRRPEIGWCLWPESAKRCIEKNL